jgi:hypothetical protein
MAGNAWESEAVRELEAVTRESAEIAASADDGCERDLVGLPLVLPRRGQRMHSVEQGAPRRPKRVRRSTLVSARYLLETFGNPIQGLLRMASFDVEALAEYLQISRHEAWIEKRLCLGMAAPYLVSKMPQGMVVAPAAGLSITGLEKFFGPAPDQNDVDSGTPPETAPGEGGFDGVTIDGLDEEIAGVSEPSDWNNDRR